MAAYSANTYARRVAILYGAPLVAGGTAAGQTAFARTDIAYARNMLTANHLRGTLGEHFAEHFFLNNRLEEKISGNWIPLAPRTGPQGLDHLFLKVGKNGHYHWMVGESKYGSSQLSTTVSGVKQLSPEWTIERIQKLGSNYVKLSQLQGVEMKQMPYVTPKAKFDVPLTSKRIVSFWQDDKGNWYFTGTKSELAAAQGKAAKMGNSLLSPNCNFRTRLFHIDVKGNDLQITICQVKSGETKSLTQLMADGNTILIKDIMGERISNDELKALIARALKNKFPNMSEVELREMSEDIAHKYKNGELLAKPRPIWLSITYQSFIAAGIAGTIDAVSQLIFTRKVHAGKVLFVGTSAGIGAATGQILNIVLLKTNVGTQAVRSISGLLNVSSGLARSALSSLSGGMVSTLLLSYGSYLLGFADIKNANRSAVAGTAGVAAGATVGIGVPALVGTFATCGTGAPIATLSGAAATKATLAWLGFGTLANGGLGATGGAIILGGYVAVAVISTSALVAFGYSLYDENEKRKYSIDLAERLDCDNIWRIISERDYVRIH